MLKKEIKYKNFDNEEVTRTFYFNLTEAEWLELEVQERGLQRMMERTVETLDVEGMHSLIKSFVLSGYGVREGDDFVKTDELRQRFMATDAYSRLFIELLQDADKAITFIRGMLPQEMLKELPSTELPFSAPPSVIPPPPMPAATVEAGRALVQDAGIA
jgi:hypothetical protein